MLFLLSNLYGKMKNVIYFISIFIILSGCKSNNPEYAILVDEAEALIQVHPDRAHILLDKVLSPDELDNRTLAHWCMLYGKIDDKLLTGLPATIFLKDAKEWYSNHGSKEELAWINLYLGRAYVEDKEYEKATEVYLEALEIATRNKLDNVAGYISSYMGDLYRAKDMVQQAREKYRQAAICFKRVENKRSYVLALRDIAFAWYRADSCQQALCCLKKADSLSLYLEDLSVRGAVLNALGNVYHSMKEWDKAEQYLLLSMKVDTTDLAPNYQALADLYIAKGDTSEARKYIEKADIPTKNKDNQVGIYYHKYKLNKLQHNYFEALANLEQYVTVLDSVTLLRNRSDILQIEKKYNHLKIREENTRLKMQRLIFMSLAFIFVICFLAGGFIYQTHKKRLIEKICRQHRMLDRLKNQLTNLSEELEKESYAFNLCQKDYKEKTEAQKRELELLQKQASLQLQEEQKKVAETNSLLTKLWQQIDKGKRNFEKLNQEYQKEIKKYTAEIDRVHKNMCALRREKLLSSPIAIRLLDFVKKKKMKSTTYLTEAVMKEIETEVKIAYPMFQAAIFELYPEISDKDWKYCCLLLFGFDTNAEAILLGINPSSVSQNRTRFRQRLGISLGQYSTLYEFFINELLKEQAFSSFSAKSGIL